MQGMFKSADYPDLVVGLGDPDDAAVWRMDETRLLIVTADFFTPVVDNPYDYGAIAAVNALSDVYAMGGKPFLALNLAALPPQLPPEITAEIMKGGAETCRDAGVAIAGGHTIQDKEPKYGLVVLGFVEDGKMMTKGGAKPGDTLVLSKPLGFGVTTTALKQDKARPTDVSEVVGWMRRLNRTAAELASQAGVKSCTDITGYSLLGHASEMANASKAGMRFWYDQIPFTRGAQIYANEWIFPGGAIDNQMYFSRQVRFEDGINDAAQMLLFDPQTSGGLLMAVPPDSLEALHQAAALAGQMLWEVGEVIEGEGIDVIQTR